MVHIHVRHQSELLDLSPFRRLDKAIIFQTCIPSSENVWNTHTAVINLKACIDRYLHFPLSTHPLISFGPRSLPCHSHLQLSIFAPMHWRCEPHFDWSDKNSKCRYEGLVRAGNDSDEATRVDFFMQGGIHCEGYKAVAQALCVRATPKPASSMAHSTVTRALALWAHT